MRDDEILGYAIPKEEGEKQDGGCFGAIVGCLVMLVLLAIGTTVAWLLW